MKLIIYTDGASRGNPGHASYGFTILDSKGKLIHEEGSYIGFATNNVAEYMAVLHAFMRVREIFPKLEQVKVELYADSKLVAEQLSGNYKIKAAHLKDLIEKIKSIASSLSEVRYKHVRRSENAKADRLANLALDRKLYS